jgi:hypothetical protein
MRSQASLKFCSLIGFFFNSFQAVRASASVYVRAKLLLNSNNNKQQSSSSGFGIPKFTKIT